uniref:PPPDE domain-containing protein n=1 Tax=viral metagenome TaxID=1070528 RepID=A0A6C0CCW2_9ZZZZ
MIRKYTRKKNLRRNTLRRKTLKRNTLKRNTLRKKTLKKKLMKTLKKRRRFGGAVELEKSMDNAEIQQISSKLSKEDITWCDKLTNILTELWSKNLINLSQFVKTRGGCDHTPIKGGNPIKKTIKYLVIFIIGLLKGILYPVGFIVIGVGTRVSGFVKLIFKIGSLICDSWSGYGTTHFKEEFKSYAVLWSFKDMSSLYIDHQKNNTDNLYIKIPEGVATAQHKKIHYTNLNDIPDNKNGDIDVYLLTFDVLQPVLPKLSSYLKYKVYHTAILLVDRRGDTSVKYHYAYGFYECGFSGIYYLKRSEAEQHTFLYANYLGRTNLTPEVWKGYIEILGKTDFEGCKYDFLLNNCCSFTNIFTRFLFQDIYWRSDINYIEDIDIDGILDTNTNNYATKLNEYLRSTLINLGINESEADKRIKQELNKPLNEIFDCVVSVRRYGVKIDGIIYLYDNRNIIIINGEDINTYPINSIDGQLMLRLLSMCCYYGNMAVINKSLFNYDLNEIKQYVSIHSIIFSDVFHQMRLGRKLSHFYEMVLNWNNSDEDIIQMLEKQKKSHLDDNLEADKFKLNCVSKNSWYSSWYRWTDTCPPRNANGSPVKGYEDKKIPKYLTDEYLECCSYDLRNIPKF